MRIKLKYIVILGLLLAAVADTCWRISHRKNPADDDAAAVDYAMRVRAREASQPSATIPIIAVTNWTTQLSAVLTSDSSTTNQAITLLAMFPNLPAEAQLEAVQHASRLLPGEYFGALGAQMTNAAATPAVRRAIFADLLTRPNSLKLPWLVEVARSSIDGQSDEALLLLKSQLREDYGTNWATWRERVAVWLSLHPD
ncbi:MAG: hypothetical protein AAB370_09735 [Verrucomicrobiota bacterium]